MKHTQTRAMGKLQTCFFFNSLAVLAMLGASAQGHKTISIPRALGTPLPVEQWLAKVTRGTGETITHLRFFIQDRISGPNQTVFNVAEALITSHSPVKFGRTQVVDHLVTAGQSDETFICCTVQHSKIWGV